MYEPPLHRQEDVAAIHALIAQHPLGLLISSGAYGLLANAIPFTLVDDGSRWGMLRCHLARANPQWRELEQGGSARQVEGEPEPQRRRPRGRRGGAGRTSDGGDRARGLDLEQATTGRNRGSSLPACGGGLGRGRDTLNQRRCSPPPRPSPIQGA